MGTDIHMVVEVFNTMYDKTWRLQLGASATHRDRNYGVFAILADVRNSDPSDPGYLVPIAEARGYPPDLDPRSREELEGGNHSRSWLLLSEILSYDWDRPFTESATIPFPAYLVWRGQQPRRHPGYDFMHPISRDPYTPSDRPRISMAEAEKIIAGEKNEFDLTGAALEYALVDVEWTEPYRNFAKRFIDWAAGLIDKGTDMARVKPEHIRLVFSFDN